MKLSKCAGTDVISGFNFCLIWKIVSFMQRHIKGANCKYKSEITVDASDREENMVFSNWINKMANTKKQILYSNSKQEQI